MWSSALVFAFQLPRAVPAVRRWGKAVVRESPAVCVMEIHSLFRQASFGQNPVLALAHGELHITGRVQRSPSAGFKGVPHTWQSGGPPDEDEEVNDERGEGQRPWLPASHLLKRLPASFSGLYDEK